MKIPRSILFVLVFAILAAGCIPDGGTAAPTLPQSTLPPAETASLVVTASPGVTETLPASTDVPAATDTVTVPTEPAVPTETDAPAPTETEPPQAEEPLEAISILQPGPGSRVTSPITLTGTADSTFEQSLVVELIRADGSVIQTTNAQIVAELGQRGPFLTDVEFTTAEEQQAFLLVYAVSPKDGGVTHLSSVGITLLPGGVGDVLSVPEGPEQIQITQPAAGDMISGGMLHVEGFGLASFEQTLVIDLLDEAGRVMTTTPVMVESSELGQPGPFSADLAYTVSAETAARLVVRDISAAHGGNSHLSSVEIRLMP